MRRLKRKEDKIKKCVFILWIFLSPLLFVKYYTLFGHKQLLKGNHGRYLEGKSLLLLSANLQVYFSVVWQVWNYLRVTTLQDCGLDKQDWGAATGHGMSLLFLFRFTFGLKSRDFFPLHLPEQIKTFSWQQMRQSLHKKTCDYSKKFQPLRQCSVL